MAKILIVEDDEAQRFLYHEELVEEGYEVVLSKNGLEALKCLEESPFDLIVLNIRMPVMNGTEVLGKISRRYKDIPVIIHTAYSEYRNQFISFMVDAFVLKSADLSLLKATVRGLLEEKKTEKGETNMAEEKQMTVEEILKMMEKGLGEEPKPMVLMSKLIPEWIPRQAQERKFVMDQLNHIPPKYKHLIMIAASAAVGCHLCTETFIKIAHRAGVTKEEIAEAILATRFALASTTFATAVEGMEFLTSKE
jgi:AhpD family alkylhydroperoxidase